MKFLSSRCRDPHLAEDLAHDTMLRATRYPAALERVDRPRAWLVQMAANVHRDHARRRARYHLAPPDDPGFLVVEGTEPHPGEPGSTDFYLVEGQRVDGDLLAREMRASWGGLPKRDQTVLDAYYGEEGGTGHAARSCGIAPSLVKVRLFRARRRLEAAVRARVDLG